jgi:SAM-dependent methyltransferase
MLTLAARHALRSGQAVSAVSFLQGTAAAIPVADETFDLALCFGVLHHTVGEGDPSGHDVLQELARVTRPGGRVVVVEPNAWNPYFFATTWVWHGLQQRVAGYPRVEHERPLTKPFLRRGLTRAGLVVERVTTASPVEAFRGGTSGGIWRAAQWALEGPLRSLGTHLVAVATRPV